MHSKREERDLPLSATRVHVLGWLSVRRDLICRN